jgi:hypothetical protein
VSAVAGIGAVFAAKVSKSMSWGKYTPNWSDMVV